MCVHVDGADIFTYQSRMHCTAKFWLYCCLCKRIRLCCCWYQQHCKSSVFASLISMSTSVGPWFLFLCFHSIYFTLWHSLELGLFRDAGSGPHLRTIMGYRLITPGVVFMLVSHYLLLLSGCSRRSYWHCVHAILVLWDNSGIQVFFFTRNNIPADLIRDAPLPNTWGLPAARFPSSTCNPYQFFQDHSAIFDTTLWYAKISLCVCRWSFPLFRESVLSFCGE